VNSEKASPDITCHQPFRIARQNARYNHILKYTAAFRGILKFHHSVVNSLKARFGVGESPIEAHIGDKGPNWIGPVFWRFLLFLKAGKTLW